jgi:hypothetical protein
VPPSIRTRQANAAAGKLAAANEVHDFDFIPIVKELGCVQRPPHDDKVSFDRDAACVNPKRLEQRLYGDWTSEIVWLSVEQNTHLIAAHPQHRATTTAEGPCGLR